MTQNSKTRRIGTATLGMGLVAFGILFLIRTFVPAFSYIWLVRLSPLLLISLGLETLLSLRSTENTKWLYDKTAVFLMIALTCFALVLSAGEWVWTHFVWSNGWYFPK